MWTGVEGVHWGSHRWRGPEWGERERIHGGVLSGGTGGEGVHWGSHRWRGPEWGDGRGGGSLGQP